MLKDIFLLLTGQYSADATLQQELWQEIKELYSGNKRYYHNLSHLKSLVNELLPLENILNNRDAVLFALFYHDVIYDAQRKDNEEQSALFASKHLKLLKCDDALIEQVEKLILATKSHELYDDEDVNLFTDADLSILGKDPETYAVYCKHVRKEYSIYPDLLYKPGRKKVLRHFLSMDRIFKTAYFYDRYEEQARQNIEVEISML